MSDLNSIEEILDFAIGEEESAAAFYTKLAGKMDKQWMKDVLLGFAKEEEGHKAVLLQMKENQFPVVPSDEKVQDLKIADYVVAGDSIEDLDYQGALILAMKREKAAFRLYSNLAEKTDSPELKQSFLRLAQEEAKHKLRFEVVYDDDILTEN